MATGQPGGERAQRPARGRWFGDVGRDLQRHGASQSLPAPVEIELSQQFGRRCVGPQRDGDDGVRPPGLVQLKVLERLSVSC